MNQSEYFLTCLAEEAGEVAKEIHKALRFGLDDKVTVDPAGPRGEVGPTCREKIVSEFMDALGAYQTLVGEGLVPDLGLLDLPVAVRAHMQKKRLKIYRYLDYAVRVGAVDAVVRSVPAPPPWPPALSDRAVEALKDVYGEETNTLGRIQILDLLLGGQSNFYGFGGDGSVTDEQKLGCLEYEYLLNLGLLQLGVPGSVGASPAGVVVRFTNEPGLSGPDTAYVQLRDGRVLVVGDEGINVYPNMEAATGGAEPAQCLTFEGKL